MRAHIMREYRTPERYAMGQVLGQGAMGIVTTAFDTHLQERVALKSILPQSKPQHREALMVEREIMQRLEHPNILGVLDYGELPNSRPYYTMPLVTGKSMDHLISKGRISLHSAIHALLKVTKALAYAHQQGVVHCDIKPGNILFSSQGEAYLIDWGTAASYESLGQSPPKTSKGGSTVFGTPLYLAPEVLRGNLPTYAADMYAVGVILYRLLSGTYPFHDKDLSVLFRRVSLEEVVPPQEHVSHYVPEVLEQLCIKLLSKDPKHRGFSCFEVNEQLAAWYNSVRRPTTPRPSWFSEPTKV